MKKFYFLTLALICAFVANAAKIPSGTELYLTPNSNWKTDNARFAAYFYGDGDGWASMTKVEGETDLYKVVTPNTGKNYTNVIFCRMNPSASANNWDNRWNQTSDLTYDGTKNHYTVAEGAWTNGAGSWSKYEKDVTTLGISFSLATIFPGDVVTINTSIMNQPEGSEIKITINGETIIGSTWTAGEAGEYIVIAECISGGATVATATETLTVTEVTSYFDIYLKKESVPNTWEKVYIYAWLSEGGFRTNTWPGTEMTETQEINGEDYYRYTIKNANSINVIFNNGNGNQTIDVNNITDYKLFELGGIGQDNKISVTSSGVPVAIEEVGVDAGEAVYYNLQGVKVANPENGIFIKKQGNKTTKVVL